MDVELKSLEFLSGCFDVSVHRKYKLVIVLQTDDKKHLTQGYIFVARSWSAKKSCAKCGE